MLLITINIDKQFDNLYNYPHVLFQFQGNAVNLHDMIFLSNLYCKLFLFEVDMCIEKALKCSMRYWNI